MNQTAFPMGNQGTGNMGMPMAGNMGMTMAGNMGNMGMPMMNNMGMPMTNYPNPMFNGNQGMCNPNMGNPNMGMFNQNGCMVGMYNMNPVLSVSNPNVPISNPSISNTNVPISNPSASSPNVPVTNTNNNENNTNYGEPPESILSRDTKLIGDPNAPTGNGMINVFFEASTGSKAVLNLNEDTPIKEALEKYAEKVKLNKQYLTNKKILFLFCSKQIDPTSTNSLKSIKIINQCTINVFDQANVLGA